MYADTSCVEKPEKRTTEEKGSSNPHSVWSLRHQNWVPVTFLQAEESVCAACQ